MDIRFKRLLVALILGLGISTGMVLTMNALSGRTQAELQDPSPVNPTQESGNWIISTVDAYRTSGVGPRSSFALDNSGTPHFAYLGAVSDSVKYAVLSGTTWISETIETDASFPRLAVDGSGTPHIIYWRPWPLCYAVRSANRWITEVVDSHCPCTSPQLLLDSSGNPHVTSHDIRPLEVGGEGLKYAHRTPSQWVTGIIEKVKGAHARLALDGSDTPHVVYTVPPARIQYAVLSGTTWISETVEMEMSATTPSLALDDSGNPHIAYTHLGSRVSYAVLSGAAWVTETIDQYATSPSLVLDGSGSPHIAYVHRDSYLSYAYLNGSTWMTETVDQVAGKFSFVLDSFGAPHIVYCSEEGLKYAYRTVLGWITEGVDGIECGSPELALDDSDSPHIGYHDTAKHDIKYARLATSSCLFRVFNDEFDGNGLDPGRWDVITGTPVVSGEWLTLSGADIQSKRVLCRGVLQGVVRSSDWKPYGESTNSSFGFEIWTGNNGQCHYGILFKANGHLAVLRSQPDANGNCFGDPSHQAYLRLSDWDAVRAGSIVAFKLSWCSDSVTLEVNSNGQEGQASYMGEAVPTVPMKIRLFAEPTETYAIDYLRLRPWIVYLPIVMDD